MDEMSAAFDEVYVYTMGRARPKEESPHLQNAQEWAPEIKTIPQWLKPQLLQAYFVGAKAPTPNADGGEDLSWRGYCSERVSMGEMRAAR